MPGGFQKKYVRAATETLRNIAAQVHGRKAKTLGADESFADDLGYDDREFENLAVWQRDVAKVLRADGSNVTILAKHLNKKDQKVRGVLGETIRRSVGDAWQDGELDALIASAQTEM